MAKYNLQPNEAVILREDRVAHGSNIFAQNTHELMLTNLNLVLVKSGVLGNGKGVFVFPLDQIKVYNGRAQAMQGAKSNGFPVLTVYMLNGEETFHFRGGKKTVSTWITKINEVVTGQENPAVVDAGRELPGSGVVAGVLKDTVGAFRTTFGSKVEEPARAAGKCGACGAPVSGTKGSTVACEYCDTDHLL